jgi:MFS family permease
VGKEINRWYFGWNIVGAAMFITLLTVGLRLGVGPFIKPIIADLGMTRTTLSLIIAIGMIVYGLGMPLAGYLCNRYSTRFVLIVGVIVILVSTVWSIMTTNIIQFGAAFGVLLSIGLAFTSPVTVTPIISRWFTRQRGKALFFLSTASMAGIAIFTPLATIFIEWIGWRGTLLAFSFLFILIVIPAAIFVMRDDAPEGTDQLFTEEKGEKTYQKQVDSYTGNWKEAMKTLPFWQIVMGLFACGFSMNLMGSHAVPMLMDHQFDVHVASWGVGFSGVVAIFSSVFLGTIADRYPKKNILFWVYFVRGLGFLGLVYVMHPWQLFLVAATGGLVWAGSMALSSAILGDLYGIRLLGLLYGWAFFGHQIGAALGSFLGGWGYDTFGTHTFAFGLAAFILVIAGGISLLLPKGNVQLAPAVQQKLSAEA